MYWKAKFQVFRLLKVPDNRLSLKVRIRGIGTVNNSEPLYIVDGMPVDGGINYLNPVDIQSVEILKDASSAAIYGARAANGVVLSNNQKRSNRQNTD